MVDGEETGERDITADDVLEALDAMDRADQAPTNTEPVKPVKPVSAKAVPKAAAEPAPVDESMALAWELAGDAVKALCPDLDDEALQLARDAAGTSPLKFKKVAETLQAKINKAKEGAPVNDRAALEAKVAAQVFGGAAAGGDAAAVPGKAEVTAKDALAEAVKDPAKAGSVMGLMVKAINEEGLLKGTKVQ